MHLQDEKTGIDIKLDYNGCSTPIITINTGDNYKRNTLRPAIVCYLNDVIIHTFLDSNDRRWLNPSLPPAQAPEPEASTSKKSVDVDSDGIPITEYVLTTIGAVKDQNGAWKLGRFLFTRCVDSDDTWSLTSSANQYGHHVTHLNECLGFIADDYFDLGASHKLAEVRDALGIGGKVDCHAVIKIPEGDPQ